LHGRTTAVPRAWREHSGFWRDTRTQRAAGGLDGLVLLPAGRDGEQQQRVVAKWCGL
jgi:hypothetical protein